MAQTFTRVSMQAARYKLMGGIEHCGRCRFFLKNNLCARVMGDISASGWCRFFSREAVMRGDAGGGAAATHGAPAAPTLDVSFMTALPAGFSYACNTVSTNLLWTAPSGTTITDYAINAPRFLTNGLLMEGLRSNRLLNSAAPASHTTASTAVGPYTAWVNGTGSMTLAAGTAVGTGFGTATQGNKLNIDISTAGTVVCTISGSLFAIQLEPTTAGEAYAPSSFIRTTGAAVARGSTVLTSGAPTGFNLAQATYVIEWLPLNSGLTNARLIEFVGTVAASDFDRLFYSTATAVRGVTTAGGVAQGNNTSGAVVSTGVVHKAGYSVSVGGSIVCVDGGTAVTIAQATRPTDLIALALMVLSTGSFNTYGYLRRFRYWPRALSGAELQSATT